jgi:alpha-tubulin suppressor-like RCC1 family protein
MAKWHRGGTAMAALVLVVVTAVGAGPAWAASSGGRPAGPAAVGATTRLALAVDHVGAKAWGPGDSGQIGDGVPFDSSIPINYAGLTSGVRQIVTGGLRTFAVLADGTVLASGYNGYGELGDGTYIGRLSAVPVVGLTGVTQVVAGLNFSMALRSDGTVWAWGANYRGQLGDGTNVGRPTPGPVLGLTGVVQIAAGDGDTAVALRADGTVWAWGENFIGQIGDGTTTHRFSPVQVSGLTSVRQIATYGYSSLAVRTDGSLWGWGDNESGQLGDGTTTDRHTPVQVPGLIGVRQAAIAGHSVAILNDGTARGWGANDRGQLGNATVGGNQLTPVVLPGLTGITQVSAGSYHSLALRTDGTVMAWGWNAHGRLGDGTHTDHPAPIPVPGLTNVTSVSAGWSSAVVVARPYFTMALSPTSGSLHAGGALTTQVRVNGFNGFTAGVSLTATGLPAGTTATFSPTTASPAAESTLILRTSLGTSAGTYPVTITASSSASAEPVHTATFTLMVGIPASFTVSLSEPFGWVYGGAATSTLVELNPINGYAGTVTVTAAMKPPPVGLVITIDPAQAGASTPATMTVSTTFDTPPGTYLIPVTGMADDPLVRPARTTMYQLTVGPPMG